MTIRNVFLAAMLAVVSAFCGKAQAQTADDTGTTTTGTDSSGGAGHGQRLSFLSAEDRQHLMRVRRQVLESNPDLKSEQERLRQEIKSAKDGGSASGANGEGKKALRGELRAHREKMNAAMIKADPTVQPILDEIEAHRKDRLQQAGGGAAGNP
jgi:hypothetical protein